MSGDQSKTIHASCVVINHRGLLILGASGRGKSSLALNLMGLGAQLVSDDRVALIVQDGTLIASAPITISGLIEARGIGILHAKPVEFAKIQCVVDLDHIELSRIPQQRTRSFMGVTVPCLHKVDNPAFPAALLQYLICGRQDPQ